LRNLFVANKKFKNFLHFLLEDKICRFFQNFPAIKFYDWLPNLLIETIIDPLTIILIEALKILFIDVYPLSVNTSIAEIVLNLT